MTIDVIGLNVSPPKPVLMARLSHNMTGMDNSSTLSITHNDLSAPR